MMMIDHIEIKFPDRGWKCKFYDFPECTKGEAQAWGLWISRMESD